MRRLFAPSRLPGWALMAALAVSVPGAPADEVPAAERTGTASSDSTDTAAERDPPRELFRGRVVRLSEALKRRDLTAAEEMDTHVVLESDDGELIPILADWRGRAFYQDERLRKRKVELVGFRRDGIPYLQVLMVFTFDEAGRRQYTDYWCDICSIPMYEIKPCDCCQAEIRLRFQQRELPDYVGKPAAQDAAAGSGESPSTPAP
jgi:hypothetical protein